MALVLPYPAYTSFTPSTIHSAETHNIPHSGLLSNDTYLAGQIDALDARVTSIEALPPGGEILNVPPGMEHRPVSVTPDYPIYQCSSAGLSNNNQIPLIYRQIARNYPAYNNTWITVPYPGTVPLYADLVSVFFQFFVYKFDHFYDAEFGALPDEALYVWNSYRYAPEMGETPAASVSIGTSTPFGGYSLYYHQAMQSTLVVEVPYSPNRTIEIRTSAPNGLTPTASNSGIASFVHCIGYRFK